MTPSLEIAAINTLQDPIAYLQADAVRALGAFGSTKAQQPLRDAFERWHLRWRDAGRKWPELPHRRMTWDEAVGDEFAEAMVSSVAWHLDQESVRRAKALCLTTRCDYATDAAEQDVAHLDIRAMPRRSLDDGPAFGVSSVHAASRSSLMKFIETFPKGTTLTWQAYQPDWDPDELQEESGRIKAMLEARGMKLEPFVYPR